MLVRLLVALCLLTLSCSASKFNDYRLRDAPSPGFREVSDVASCNGKDIKGLAREVKTLFDKTLDRAKDINKDTVSTTPANKITAEAAYKIWNQQYKKSAPSKEDKKNQDKEETITYPTGRVILDKVQKFYRHGLSRLMANNIEVECGGAEWKWVEMDPTKKPPKGASSCDPGYWRNSRTRIKSPLHPGDIEKFGIPKPGQDICDWNTKLAAFATEAYDLTICDRFWNEITLATAKATIKDLPDGTRVDKVLARSAIALHEIMHLTSPDVDDKDFTYKGKSYPALGSQGCIALRMFHAKDVLLNADSYAIFAMILNLIPYVAGDGLRERKVET